MSKQKTITIGSSVKTVLPVADAVREAGISFYVRDDGEAVFRLKFPGQTARDFCVEDLELISAVLDRPTVEGSDPGAVFARSASEDSEGNLTARFSDEKRSRSIEIPSSERENVTNLCRGLMVQVPELEQRWSEAQKQADSDENKGE